MTKKDKNKEQWGWKLIHGKSGSLIRVPALYVDGKEVIPEKKKHDIQEGWKYIYGEDGHLIRVPTLYIDGVEVDLSKDIEEEEKSPEDK